ncbi:hypothetical protein O1611_g3740 [Lasiodiplodia mahajangana]|uniref:Uncharacterized protein n=1 Tax=Lasiodiplodia mahajangana TaxID=1108764 RepID=A0ACC2JQV8_9PEZI|nr:hypothetical protein O1611_g3740 [Lasiodiplodia mahajangana]
MVRARSALKRPHNGRNTVPFPSWSNIREGGSEIADNMAAATNGDAAAALDDIKPPQGVILPPKEFRGEHFEAPTYPEYHSRD